MQNGYFKSAQGTIVRRSDPLALDLNGGGLISTVSADELIMFDYNGNNVKQATGWIGKEDGLLVFDRNGDGIINDGSELFSEFTHSYGYRPGDLSGNPATPFYCRDAFQALAQEDTNFDGVVNHLDTNWSKLQIWQDLNQDGISNLNILSHY